MTVQRAQRARGIFPSLGNGVFMPKGISQACIKFLRKTKLQVRIAVEVIHRKSTKYMITEAIDGRKHTLVVLGSRGRSPLKGALLGSFSNYLVTKSSVSVMAARKKVSGRKSRWFD